jgi:hypothetical protein
MPNETLQSRAEWNAAFEALKLAHERLRDLVHLLTVDPERREAPKNGLMARAAYTAPAPRSRPN